MLPVDVVFLHLRRSAATEQRIRARAEELAAVHPSLVGCRVLIEVPHKHHAGGKRFRVRIELGLPRREDIVVERGPAGRAAAVTNGAASLHKADEVDAAFTDLHVVLHEAFDAATRRLQTIAQRRRSAARARDAQAKAAAGRSLRAANPRVRRSG